MSSRKKPVSKKYKGVLAEPIVRPNSSHSEAERKAFVWIKWMEKLTALREHYGIEQGENMFLHLTFALAQEYVPGFAVVNELPKRHRPPDLIDDAHIYIAVEQQLKLAGDGNVRRAVRLVATNNPKFKDFKKTPDSLRTRYTRIKDSIDKLTQDAEELITKGEHPNPDHYSHFAVMIFALQEIVRKMGAPEEAIFELADHLPERTAKKKPAD